MGKTGKHVIPVKLMCWSLTAVRAMINQLKPVGISWNQLMEGRQHSPKGQEVKLEMNSSSTRLPRDLMDQSGFCQNFSHHYECLTSGWGQGDGPSATSGSVRVQEEKLSSGGDQRLERSWRSKVVRRPAELHLDVEKTEAQTDRRWWGVRLRIHYMKQI